MIPLFKSKAAKGIAPGLSGDRRKKYQSLRPTNASAKIGPSSGSRVAPERISPVPDDEPWLLEFIGPWRKVGVLCR